MGKFVNHATDGQGGNAEFRKAAEVGPGVDRTGAVARRTDYSLADIAATLYMARLEMLKLARLWDHKPGVAEWWRRIKALPCYETAVTKWLRPQDIARYAKLTDPWIDVSRNLAARSAMTRLESSRTV